MNDGSAKKIAILIAGMHRSGTSALTRVLNIAGCDLPKTVMKPKRDNVAGFWESPLFMNLNEEILASAGSFEQDWRPFEHDWYSSSAASDFRERAQGLLQDEFGSSRLFVLKDPRICRLMEFWIEAVRVFGARPLVVSPVRNPLDVVASLQVRNDIDPAVGLLIWLRHVLDAEADSRRLKRAYLRYEQLLWNAHTVVETIGRELGVSWPRRPNPHLEMEIAEFLSPELHHHQSQDASLLSNPSISDWIRGSFEIFDRWARGEVRKEDEPNLDRIKAAFDEAVPAFTHALAIGQQEKERGRALSLELDTFQRMVADRGGRMETLSGRLRASRREVSDCKARIEALSRDYRRVMADREQKDRDMGDTGSDLKADCNSIVFPTLDMDLGEGLGGPIEEVKRICIATPDILGPVKNGGIGTAYHHLARLLAGWGHNVVIAYVGSNAVDERLMQETRSFYAGFGIAFEPIVPRPAVENMLSQVAAPTWALLDWLRGRERCFDIVHASDWHGLGYGPLLAKSLGLAFGATHFVVHGHAPTLWHVEGNRQVLSSERELGWVFMERRSVELADTVTCGSAYLVEWMRDAGYVLPARSFVWPNPFPVPDLSPAAATERVARDGARLEEVVFFGRLEPRKGLVPFVDAIGRLVRQRRSPKRVTFLGKASIRIDGPGFIQSSTRDWPIEIRTITDFSAEEAVAYLSQPGRLAVLPSLQENSSLAVTECLHAGIPFVASAVGGTPELVASTDHSRALVAPDHIALGDRIADLASAPLRAVRPRWGFERSLEVWSRWHAQRAPFEVTARWFAERSRVADAETPLVTVCIAHHERPKLVRMAVDSVLAQDYPALDVVLVDNGSENREAVATLDAFEAEFAERGWRVLRQENRYAGAARNTAAAAARGKWLLFLDDDNVLFPDAVYRLVRAARFSGADCVPAASIRFFGDGDPRTNSGTHGTPMRFLGAARAWSHFQNVVGGTCVLVRREVFEVVGGFSEENRVGFEDLSFFNRLIRSGHRIEPMPDPAYYCRIAKTNTKGPIRVARDARFGVLAPRIEGLSDEDRAFFAFAIGQADVLATGSSKSPNVIRMLAEQAMYRRYWLLAGDLWSELRDVTPEKEEGYVRGAEALLRADRLDEAERLACDATECFPNRPGGYVQRAEVAMRHRDWEAACRLWAELRRAFPSHAPGYVRGAASLRYAGRLEEAEALGREAVERFPDRPGGHYTRAEVAMCRKDWALASELWGEFRRAFPDHPSGYMRGAASLRYAGRLEEAEALAREAVERFPDRPGGHYTRAEVAMCRKDWALASELWGEFRRAFPDSSAGYVRGVKALRGAGRLEEAEVLAGGAMKRFPGAREYSGESNQGRDVR